MSSTSSSDIDKRIVAAQALLFDINNCATMNIRNLVEDNSKAVGCPFEFIYFPMLTLTAHFIGPGARVLVNKDWKEPVIMWTVILADKGQKKSPALSRFLGPIKVLEEKMIDQQKDISINCEVEEGSEKNRQAIIAAGSA